MYLDFPAHRSIPCCSCPQQGDVVPVIGRPVLWGTLSSPFGPEENKKAKNHTKQLLHVVNHNLSHVSSALHFSTIPPLNTQ